jgi:hypothetical protein
MIKDTSALREGDLLKLHSHPTREFTREEEEHGPSIKLHPAASEHSTRPTYIHGVLFWTVLRVWARDWVEVVSNDDRGETFQGWANVFSNTFELVVK